MFNFIAQGNMSGLLSVNVLLAYVDRSTMPKEQGYFWEGAARGSSKTAKNKSNSAALQAALVSIHRNQSGMGEMNNHLVPCDGEKDSEKDSGYSGNHVPRCMPALEDYTRDYICNVVDDTPIMHHFSARLSTNC